MEGKDFMRRAVLEPVLEPDSIIPPGPASRQVGTRLLDRALSCAEFIEGESSMAHPATQKRGGDPDVNHKHPRKGPDDELDRKLEEGLEESMAGSDPVSITQPAPSTVDKKDDKKHARQERPD
jgi:hypothetical protein